MDELPVPPEPFPLVELVPPAELGVPVALFIPLPAPIGLDALPVGIVDVFEVPLPLDAPVEEAPILEVELPVLDPESELGIADGVVLVPVVPLVPELAPELPELPEEGIVVVEEDEPVEPDEVGVDPEAVSSFFPQADKDKAEASTTAETVTKPSRD